MRLRLEDLPPHMREAAMKQLTKEQPRVEPKPFGLAVVKSLPTPPAPEVQSGPKYRSKWEKEFNAVLKARFPLVEYEPVKLKLASGAVYTPDFMVIGGFNPECPGPVNVIFYEVKGFWREAARVRIKVAARLFPWARFVAVVKQKKRDGGGWIEEVFPS